MKVNISKIKRKEVKMILKAVNRLNIGDKEVIGGKQHSKHTNEKEYLNKHAIETTRGFGFLRNF